MTSPVKSMAARTLVGADLRVRPNCGAGFQACTPPGGADILVCPESTSGGCTHPPERTRRPHERFSRDTGFQPVPNALLQRMTWNTHLPSWVMRSSPVSLSPCLPVSLSSFTQELR